MKLQQTKGYQVINDWLNAKGYRPFTFQEQTWQHIANGESGLVNAPTGFGKTFSVFLGALIQFINEHPGNYTTKGKNGMQLLWISPLRALAKDIGRAMQEVIAELGMSWQVGIRNGDTDMAERQRQKRNMPEVLIITPESLHLLLAQKGYPEVLEKLRIIAVDEWHELLGSKRGVQVELALTRIIHVQRRMLQPGQQPLRLWGISATIGNLDQAREVLLAPMQQKGIIVKADLDKKIHIESVLPDEIEKYPWAGHLGIKLAHKIVPIIEQSNTTLIFINTRGMSEMWYQTLLNIAPQLAGAIALHHGSIEQELRIWVEEALHTQKLKAVVCTASLDLGVDFRPVDTVIQVGSPKGVARFLQRAGRSGHQPGEISTIYFLPTHSLELVEAAALKQAIKEKLIESRDPMLLCFDVLTQFLCTLAVSEGFSPDEVYKEVKATYCFADMQEEEWREVLQHITTGGTALQQYDEYRKVEAYDGRYYIRNRRIAMRHRMHIGTIVSDAMLKVKFASGGFIGVIEEYFISRLSPGDTFTLAGRNLELIAIKDMTVLVKKSNATKSIVPSWNGGRMPLSANLGLMLRQTFNHALTKKAKEPELAALKPLFELQEQLSHIPKSNELLVEHIETKDGYHLFVYPFEGRLVHEAMGTLLAYRISRLTPITFSIAMNDYGFELLSDQPIPVDDTNVYEIFTPDNLLNDIHKSVNAVEMAKRKFRDISVIAGLVFQGYPGEHKKARHLQSSASLLFKVFAEYDPKNILIRQAFQEVLDQQMEEVRLRNALQRIQEGKIVITVPERLTPFCFPIKVDSLRENLSSEKLEDRVRRMQQQLEK
ncbi:ligase-associated DNA damage response DEXH box helicase [Deminuibacter soli]|uniref:Ligase-associated DNA damage response DEXH box helicase n=1 Tax=Deminuibacter soli TaxID=2291815 RepID=A0A3E1NLB3_9BACT|nr:ligase-associated DNA damage response DEXH box helicase [Deminuibacter soli]RFM28634.1 ligase-associated DNA damage response DEXH box helicase [Deminuibacter soli]